MCCARASLAPALYMCQNAREGLHMTIDFEHQEKAWSGCSNQTADLHGNHPEVGYFSRPPKIAARSWKIMSFLPMKQ